MIKDTSEVSIAPLVIGIETSVVSEDSKPEIAEVVSGRDEDGGTLGFEVWKPMSDEVKVVRGTSLDKGRVEDCGVKGKEVVSVSSKVFGTEDVSIFSVPPVEESMIGSVVSSCVVVT